MLSILTSYSHKHPLHQHTQNKTKRLSLCCTNNLLFPLDQATLLLNVSAMMTFFMSLNLHYPLLLSSFIRKHSSSSTVIDLAPIILLLWNDNETITYTAVIHHSLECNQMAFSTHLASALCICLIFFCIRSAAVHLCSLVSILFSSGLFGFLYFLSDSKWPSKIVICTWAASYLFCRCLWSITILCVCELSVNFIL